MTKSAARSARSPFQAMVLLLSLMLPLLGGCPGELVPGASMDDRVITVNGPKGEPDQMPDNGSDGAEDNATPASGQLCDACTAHEDCGGPEDYCIKNSSTSERFCGQDCSAGQSCPAGYSCLTVTGTVTAQQCIPLSKTCQPWSPSPSRDDPDDDDDSDDGSGGGGSTACPGVDTIRLYSLQRLNDIRAGRNPPLPPYTLDDCLNQVATEANDEWDAGGPAHGKFVRECITIRPNCECNWQQENMGASWGSSSSTSWQDRIDKILAGMMSEEPYNGGHFKNIVSTTWTRVGVGVICTATSIRFTHDFGP